MHKGRWHDGREVAVKVQYPGAGEALLLRPAPARAGSARTIGPLVPGIDIKPLVEEMQARAVDELDYKLEAEAQRAFAEAFRDDPDIVVPDVVALGDTVLVTEWLESPASLASVITRAAPRRSATTTASCSCGSCSPARRAPGCCTPTRTPATSGSCPNDDGSPGRLGVLDFGAVARLPERGLPDGDGPPDPDRRRSRTGEALLDGLRDEGFIKDRIRLDPELLLDYLSPFVEPTQVERFRFTREWMRAQFQRHQQPPGAGVHGRDASSTCRRRTCSSTAPGSAASACSASSRRRRRSARSSRSTCRASPTADASQRPGTSRAGRPARAPVSRTPPARCR